MTALDYEHEDPFLQRIPRGAVDVALSRMFPQASVYADDPVTWAREKMKLYLWTKQVEILEALRDNRLVAVQSAHGTGKSFSASVAGSWWLDPDVHPLGSAFLVSTAPSWPQVEAILWREIRRRHSQGGLPGRITLDCQWMMGHAGTKRGDSSEEIIGMGRKPQDYDETTFQGIHARYFMAILDEAGGIPEQLWNSVLSLVTNEHARVLAIGNPDDPNSHFAQVCKPGSGWKVIKISVWDSPNFTGEEVPEAVGESLVSKLWVEDRRRDWGEGSNLWTAKVDGEFPDVSDEYLISPSLVAYAQSNDLAGLGHGRYGMDVARLGKDKTVIYRNRDGVIRLVEAWSKQDTMQSAGRAARILNQSTWKIPMVIDIIGLGAGVYDRLHEQQFDVVPHQGSQAAHNPAKFKNRRSEVWWTFRELMEAGLIDLDYEDDTLAAELQSIKWDTDSSGRIYVETKEDMEKRGIASPNHADAAVMSATTSPVYGLTKRKVNTITSDLMQKVM